MRCDFKIREKIVLEWPCIGRGNENDVYPLLMRGGRETDEAMVAKIGNGAFCGWQSPLYVDIQRYRNVLEKAGIQLRDGLEVLTKPEIEMVRSETRRELELTIGYVLKLITMQKGRPSDFAIVEQYSEATPMTLKDIVDTKLGGELWTFLLKAEEIYKETGLFPDPIGGSSITDALKSLVMPDHEATFGNLEVKEGTLVLTDIGMLDVNTEQRVWNIPGTNWMMRLMMLELGHLGLEAMNIGLRDHDYAVKKRPLGVANAIPKVVAWCAYHLVKSGRSFWSST